MSLMTSHKICQGFPVDERIIGIFGFDIVLNMALIGLNGLDKR
jgi:hypothetical protein